jgi:hypothetical protein
MLVNRLPASAGAAFTMIALPEQSETTRRWIENQFYAGRERLTQLGQSLAERAVQLYNMYNDSEFLKTTRKLTRAAKGIFSPNTIQYLGTLDELVAAQPLMQRYIMAEPTIRALYHKQRCDGYSDSYVDHHPKDIGPDHYDYRRVMNGAIEFKEDGDWYITMYPDELIEGDRELDVEEQFLIEESWEAVRRAILQNFDPTDILKGRLT